MAETYDMIIKNGRIIDGTGNGWYQADIGIVGHQITAISHTTDGMAAARVLDAAGMVVSPGFIDPATGCVHISYTFRLHKARIKYSLSTYRQ